MKNISNILIKNWDITKEYHYSDGKVYHNNEQADLGLLLEMNPEVSGLIVDYDYYF